MSKRRVAPLWLLSFLVPATACTSVLGIEELHEGLPSAGPGEGAPDGAFAGGLREGGAASSERVGAEGSPSGDASAADASVADAREAAAPDVAPRDAAVESAPTPDAADPPAAVTVQGDAVAPYDVAVVIGGSLAGNIGTQGWLYQGLRRADPTLQVYVALPERSNSVRGRISNVVFPLPASDSILVAFGSADGSLTFARTFDAFTYGPARWRGPAQTTGTLHALRATHAGTSALGPVTAYLGYDARPALLDDGSPTAEVPLDLGATAIAAANVTGTVTSASGTVGQNDVWLAWPGGAAMHVMSDSKGDGAFGYLVPTLAGASVILSAERGNELDATFFVVTMGTTARLAAFGSTGLDVPQSAGGSWYLETHGPYASIDDAAGPTGMLDAFRGAGAYLRQTTPSRSYSKRS